MKNISPNSQTVFSHKELNKSNHFQIQLDRVIESLYSQPKTMLMVSIETGILRANICRYIAQLQKQNRIKLVRKSICTISKHRAGFYTANPDLFPSILGFSNTEKL